MSRAQLTSTVEQNTGGAVAPFVAGKNFAANGNFDYWQRGTSGFTTLVYSADRWYINAGQNFSISQESTVVPTGSTYTLKITSTGGSSYCNIYQAFEDKDVNFLAGKTITATAYVQANSTYTGTVAIAFDTNTTANTMTGGTWTNQINGTYVTPSTSGWSKVTTTYTVPSGTKGLRIGLVYSSFVPSGSILYWAQVQLEVGSVATPFSRAGGTLQGELALCQRYYYRMVGARYGMGYAKTGTSVNGIIYFPVIMRTAPTALEQTGTATDYGISYLNSFTSCSSVPTFSDATVYNSLVAFTTSNILTAGNGVVMSQNNTSGYLGFSAEL